MVGFTNGIQRPGLGDVAAFEKRPAGTAAE